MASLLIYMLFSMTVLAANAPKYNSPYVLDPLNDTAHGIMLSPERMIIKLDCPGCPVYKPKWRTESIALVSRARSLFIKNMALIRLMIDIRLSNRPTIPRSSA